MLKLNAIPIIPTIFPDGTAQVWKLPEKELNRKHSVITWIFENEGEFLHLAQLKTLLDEYHVSAVLDITYLPYGRQDKDVTNHSTFALHTFAKLLNSLNFTDVLLTDPHSEKASDLINNVITYYPTIEIAHAINACQTDLICYPDNGALKKYTSFEDLTKFPSIYASKIRDATTGNILELQLHGDPRNKNILIVDDICDGGATFQILAKELLNKGAKSVNLFVTHGLFTKGTDVLKASGIKRIFTSNGEVER